MARPRNDPLSTDPAFVAGVRRALAAARFDDPGIADRLGAAEAVRFDAKSAPRLLRMTAGGAPLDAFIRLFMLNATVEREGAERAVAPMSVKDWIEGGLLEERSGGVGAAMRLVPHEGRLFAFDPPFERASPPDYVIGLGRFTGYLHYATVRRPARRALDLGTGCGVQAIFAAAHAERVVATDVNERALRVAAFNAALAGAANVELRRGSLYEPAGDAPFDLITMNPPFAIAPDARFQYRDGGFRADGFVEALVRGAPARLSEGGLLQTTAQWAHLSGVDWKERLAAWVAPGCDAWIVALKTDPIEAYAADWITETERPPAGAYPRRWEEWMAALTAQGIERVSSGFITLRKRSGGTNRVRFDEDAEDLRAGAGDAIALGLALGDFLEAADDARLLAEPLRVSPLATLVSESGSEGRGWGLARMTLRLGGGIPRTGEADPIVADAVGRCDGKTALGAVAEAVAARAETDPGRLRAALLPIVRRLVERGFLLPKSVGTAPCPGGTPPLI